MNSRRAAFTLAATAGGFLAAAFLPTSKFQGGPSSPVTAAEATS